MRRDAAAVCAPGNATNKNKLYTYTCIYTRYVHGHVHMYQIRTDSEYEPQEALVEIIL